MTGGVLIEVHGGDRHLAHPDVLASCPYEHRVLVLVPVAGDLRGPGQELRTHPAQTGLGVSERGAGSEAKNPRARQVSQVRAERDVVVEAAYAEHDLVIRRVAGAVLRGGAVQYVADLADVRGRVLAVVGGAINATSSGAEMPTETAGPYPGDGSNGADVLEISGVERSDIRSSIDGGATAEGVDLTLTMDIIDLVEDGAAMTGAAVYVWHCDAQGGYSMYGDGLTEETYLRGVQVVGEDGTVTFTTTFPGCYSGRWPHIHFEVFPDFASITDATNAALTSQIALPEEACAAVYARSEYSGSAENMAEISLESDGIFSDGADMQMATMTGDVDAGYTATIDVPIDTSTEEEAGGGQGGPGGGGQPPEGAPRGQAPTEETTTDTDSSGTCARPAAQETRHVPNIVTSRPSRALKRPGFRSESQQGESAPPRYPHAVVHSRTATLEHWRTPIRGWHSPGESANLFAVESKGLKVGRPPFQAVAAIGRRHHGYLRPVP